MTLQRHRAIVRHCDFDSPLMRSAQVDDVWTRDDGTVVAVLIRDGWTLLTRPRKFEINGWTLLTQGRKFRIGQGFTRRRQREERQKLAWEIVSLDRELAAL